jgi:hypothetical protein
MTFNNFSWSNFLKNAGLFSLLVGTVMFVACYIVPVTKTLTESAALSLSVLISVFLIAYVVGFASGVNRTLKIDELEKRFISSSLMGKSFGRRHSTRFGRCINKEEQCA